MTDILGDIQATGISRRTVVTGIACAGVAACSPVALRIPPGPLRPDADKQTEIRQIAVRSEIADYFWRHRGKAPAGYIQGMALAYASEWAKLAAKIEPALAMSVAVQASDNDGLNWCANSIRAAGGGFDDEKGRLRDVFAVLLGLGMRESSGMTCEGRDLSANNTTADTAEAGLFQVSFDSVAAAPELGRLFSAYQGRTDLLDVFSIGVRCRTSAAKNIGSGPGRDFQALTKRCPAFAVEYAGVLLRHQARHWGPLNRREVEVIPESYALLATVEASMAG